MVDSTSTFSLVPAAQYVRMSTEHQHYSADNQAAAIELYAAANGYEVVRTYADLGRSGLMLQNRPALRQLLSDVEGGAADFRAILVYDVSRWGRFQDPDDAAACEAACKHAGVAVHYCAELFSNDGSAAASILKALKRVMAAEYSRELSEKTSAAQHRAASFGFITNRWTPFGMRRLAVDHRGCPVRVLENGEINPRGCRVTLVPGPDHEVALVRRIFRLFGQHGWTRKRIADTLNKEGVRNRHGDIWLYGAIRNLLKCEAYIGNHVFGKTTMRLGGRQRRVARTAWTRAEGVYQPIISRRLFEKVQKRLAEAIRPADDRMLEQLRDLLARHGYLNTHLMRAEPGMARASTYAKRFGSLAEAYRLAGYAPRNLRQAAAVSQGTQWRRNVVMTEAADILRAEGLKVVIDGRHSRLWADRGLVIDVRACMPRYEPIPSWANHTANPVKAPLTLIARLNDALEPVDYCLLTAASFRGRTGIYMPATFQCRDGVDIFSSLDELYDRCLRLLGSSAPTVTATT